MTTDPETWLAWTRELHAIAQAGLAYAESPYDLQRYTRLREITADVMVALAEAPPEPIRTAILAETGYLTPKLDVRAAVYDPQGRILMVREAAEGRWSLPGGWADVNENLVAGAIREVWEETGYRVELDRLLGIYDKRRWGAPPSTTFALTTVVSCHLVGGRATTSHETDAVAWVSRDEVPPLSTGRTPAALLDRIFAHHDTPTLPADLH